MAGRAFVKMAVMTATSLKYKSLPLRLLNVAPLL